MVGGLGEVNNPVREVRLEVTRWILMIKEREGGGEVDLCGGNGGGGLGEGRGSGHGEGETQWCVRT